MKKPRRLLASAGITAGLALMTTLALPATSASAIEFYYGPCTSDYLRIFSEGWNVAHCLANAGQMYHNIPKVDNLYSGNNDGDVTVYLTYNGGQASDAWVDFFNRGGGLEYSESNGYAYTITRILIY